MADRATSGLVILLAWAVACSSTNGAPAPRSNECEDDGSAPRALTCTGLYSDWETLSVDPSNRDFVPGVQLWSDGVEKRRFIHLPPGTKIDVSDPDAWTFPVGTKTWKEFSWRGRKLETRYFAKVRDDKWVRATYLWSEDQRGALREDNGARIELDGLTHDVPDTNRCDRCHDGRPDRLLGFEAFALAHPDARGVTLSDLRNEQRLTGDPSEAEATIVGFATARPEAGALAWMHINCGISCHNRTANANALASDLFLRLDVAQLRSARSIDELDPLSSAVGRAAKTPRWAGELRIAPGNPDASLVYRLATSRGDEQMPPFGTRKVDEPAASALRELILSLSPREPSDRVGVMR